MDKTAPVHYRATNYQFAKVEPISQLAANNLPLRQFFSSPPTTHKLLDQQCLALLSPKPGQHCSPFCGRIFNSRASEDSVFKTTLICEWIAILVKHKPQVKVATSCSWTRTQESESCGFVFFCFSRYFTALECHQTFGSPSLPQSKPCTVSSDSK